jgi:hypothetical protein
MHSQQQQQQNQDRKIRCAVSIDEEFVAISSNMLLYDLLVVDVEHKGEAVAKLEPLNSLNARLFHPNLFDCK